MLLVIQSPEGRNNENWTLYLEGSCLLQLPLRFSFLSGHEKEDNIILVFRIFGTEPDPDPDPLIRTNETRIRTQIRLLFFYSVAFNMPENLLFPPFFDVKSIF